MYPVLFQLGSFTVFTYGLFVALGFISLMSVTRYYFKALSISQNEVNNIFLVGFFSALIGARLMYISLNWGAFKTNVPDIFKVWNGGLVFFGGFVFTVPVVVIYLKLKNMDIWQTADILSPGLALGHAFGRIGCFFAGCCYGKECHMPIAAFFTHPKTLAPLNIGLHPTQLYEAVSNFILFFILAWLMKIKKKQGTVFLVYMILYSMDRMIIEFFRGDIRGYFFFDFISISQGIAVLVLAAALVILLYRLRTSHAADSI